MIGGTVRNLEPVVELQVSGPSHSIDVSAVVDKLNRRAGDRCFTGVLYSVTIVVEPQIVSDLEWCFITQRLDIT